MTRPASRPTRTGFLRWLEEAGHPVTALDVISIGVYFRQYANLIANNNHNG